MSGKGLQVVEVTSETCAGSLCVIPFSLLFILGFALSVFCSINEQLICLNMSYIGNTFLSSCFLCLHGFSDQIPSSGRVSHACSSFSTGSADFEQQRSCFSPSNVMQAGLSLSKRLPVRHSTIS